MRRLGLGVALALGLILAPPVGRAQQPGKVYRIGILSPGREPPIQFIAPYY
jgi:hypothetical protein